MYFGMRSNKYNPLPLNSVVCQGFFISVFLGVN